jgi:hypothetical protein
MNAGLTFRKVLPIFLKKHDRIKCDSAAAGNGQVPAVAALAWQVLTGGKYNG